MAGYGLPEYVRITVGREEENLTLIRGLEAALSEKE
jgi:histidinol-phosphate/aromatic aminotransferase/cobyric acid decarboxylase-like protein